MKINQIEKVTTLWVTSDGTEFIDYEIAKTHEFKLDIIKIVGRFYYSGIDLEDIVLGLIEHFDDILFLEQ